MIADDHPVVIEGIRRHLARCDDLDLIAEAGCADEVRRFLEEENTPDVVVLDIQMPGMSDASIVTYLSEKQIGVCLFTLREEDAFVLSMLAAGARGFVSKSESISRLIEAIRVVGSGGSYLPDTLKTKLEQLEDPPHDQLSEREFAVFELFYRGLSVKEIAFELGNAASTVYKHIERVKQKLQIDNRADALAYAIEWNLTTARS